MSSSRYGIAPDGQVAKTVMLLSAMTQAACESDLLHHTVLEKKCQYSPADNLLQMRAGYYHST